MKNKIKNREKGFSLIEAMIAMAVVGIAFVGVFGLTSYSASSLNSATKQQSLQILANQILEVIESDQDNILSYNLDFTTCTAPTSEQTQTYHTYRYKWCRMLNAEIGTPRAGDIRNVSVVNSLGEIKVHITLQGVGGSPEVVLKRVYEN